jgi:hypothetical protein
MKTFIRDVFKTVGLPTHTYVERDNGSFENKLKASILADGNLCLLTGPSKTGKTTLYNKVLNDLDYQPLLIRCDEDISTNEFWKKILEKVNFSRVSKRENAKSIVKSGQVKVGVEFGWQWLSKIIGEVNLGISKEKSETEVREIILSNPSPDHLIPILKELNYFLVVEDFHYLKQKVQKVVFQQWKTFIDNEISVLVVGTTHHAVDIAFANKDLTGRITHLEVGMWSEGDLAQIVTKGFNYIHCQLIPDLRQMIVRESVGLPIITQSICYQLFVDKGISTDDQVKIVDFTKGDIHTALFNVATEKYGQFKTFYDILSEGLKSKLNKHNTYNLVLLIFSIDPPVFSLSRREIDERIAKVVKNKSIPPPNSLNNTLAKLSRLQRNKEMLLLEWSSVQNKLYILEPAFLFYIRWRDQKSPSRTLYEFIDEILKNFKLFQTIDIAKYQNLLKK